MSATRASRRCSPATPTSRSRTTDAPRNVGDDRGLVADRHVAGPRAHDRDRRGGRQRRGIGAARQLDAARARVHHRVRHARRDRAGLVVIDERRERSTAAPRELGQRRRDLLGGLARAEHQLRHAGPRLAIVIDDQVRHARFLPRSAGGSGGSRTRSAIAPCSSTSLTCCTIAAPRGACIPITRLRIIGHSRSSRRAVGEPPSVEVPADRSRAHRGRPRA